MNKAIEHALIVLQKQDDWMTKESLELEVKQLFPKISLYPVFKYLYNRANIGHDKGSFRWYEPNDLTNHVQECLNRGDNW